jgi:hypothetical protein
LCHKIEELCRAFISYLLAAALAIVGAYGAAVVITTAAIVVGLASQIEKREQKQPG